MPRTISILQDNNCTEHDTAPHRKYILHIFRQLKGSQTLLIISLPFTMNAQILENHLKLFPLYLLFFEEEFNCNNKIFKKTLNWLSNCSDYLRLQSLFDSINEVHKKCNPIKSQWSNRFNDNQASTICAIRNMIFENAWFLKHTFIIYVLKGMLMKVHNWCS